MAPETTSAQDSLEKGALWWPGGGPREDIYWKMLKVSLCASDFSSQRQKRGLGVGKSHLRDHLCQLC